MQQNPNPSSGLPFLQPTNYSYNPNLTYPYQTTTVNSHNPMYQNHHQPPGTDPLYLTQPSAVPYTHNSASYETQQVAASTYYQDPNAVAYYQNPNAVSYYQDPNTVSYYQDPNAITQLGPISYAPGAPLTTPSAQPQKRNIWKKSLKAKKTKIVQSVCCEVCKIACNSDEILVQHKLGKKHTKNLEKLKAKFTSVPPPFVLTAPLALAPVVVPAPPLPVFVSAETERPIIGPAENPITAKLSSSQISHKKAANARKENLETKKRRVVEGGAASGAVRECHLCNVVCNSDTVFNFHLQGQKHANQVKKYVSGTSVASAI